MKETTFASQGARRRVAITGGRGRLAPLVARFFADQGWEPVLYSREGGETFLSLAQLPAELNGFDALVHCAWSSVPLTAERDPDSAEKTDLPLLRTLLQASPAGQPFVFLSTAAVYGNTGTEPVDEDQIPCPRGRYAAGKLAAESLAASAGRTILRVTNLVGERPDPARPQGIVPRLVHAAQSGEPVVIWGDGEATKDYLHCADFLTALQAVVEHALTGIYNVSAGVSRSLRELIQVVERESGKPVPVVISPGYPWDVTYSAVSSEKLRRATGWKPVRTPAEAVREYLGSLK